MNAQSNLDLFMSILGLLILIIHRATMLITFPNRFKLRYSIGILILALFATNIFRNLTGDFIQWNGLSTFFNLILMCWLLKGSVFQITFAYYFLYIFTVVQLYLAESVIGVFIDKSGENFPLILFIFTMTMYTAYVYLMFKYGRKIFQRLLENGQSNEWALYAFGAVFSFILLTVSRDYPNTVLLNILLQLFIVWSFVVFCFAIINSHEKSKQRYETEFAREIISSGRGHYKKMNEMYDKLRILRHDYKYHLNAARKMLNSGKTEDADKYLNDIENQLASFEIRSYCSNPVINALVSDYAERCTKMNIKLDVNINMPEQFQVPNYDICIVLGNLLENAAEACGGIEQNRWIELTTQNIPAQLLFMVKNSFDGKVYQDKGVPVSKKSNGGFGLRSVREVIARYGGDLLTEWDNDTFTVYAAVKL